MRRFINLNEIELHLAETIAKKRMGVNLERSIINESENTNDKLKEETDGIAAEIAFCKLYNLYPEMEMDTFRDYDVILSSGEKVDIKSTYHKKGKLLVAESKKDKDYIPDYYVLLIGSGNLFECMGFFKGEDVFKEERLQSMGNNNAYVVNQHELSFPSGY